MGVKKGSRVALWGYNAANWLIAFFAIVRAGGTAVLVNYSMSSQDAAELLGMTETGFLLCGDNLPLWRVFRMNAVWISDPRSLI